jgi:hypothetical protein
MKMPSTRVQLKKAQQELTDFRDKTKQLLYSLAYPKSRTLLTIDAADAQGKLNGITVVELLTIINLSKATGERIVLRAVGKSVVVDAETLRPTISVSSL